MNEPLLFDFYGNCSAELQLFIAPCYPTIVVSDERIHLQLKTPHLMIAAILCHYQAYLKDVLGSVLKQIDPSLIEGGYSVDIVLMEACNHWGEDLELGYLASGRLFYEDFHKPVLPPLTSLEVPDHPKRSPFPCGWILTLESGETVQVVSALGPDRIEFSSLEVRDKDGNIFGIQWNPNMRFTQPETP